MSKQKVLPTLILLLLLASPAYAQDQRFTLGLAIGGFDVDTDDADTAHFNELSYNVLFGYDWSRYFALEVEAFRVDEASEIDVFRTRSSFGGDAIGLSARIQWPLSDDFSAYFRVGAAAFDLSEAEIMDEPLDQSWQQPVYGGGIRGDYWFVEYVNYGEIEDFHLEQLRGGVIIRF